MIAKVFARAAYLSTVYAIILLRLGGAEKLLNLTTISQTCAAQFSEGANPT